MAGAALDYLNSAAVTDLGGAACRELLGPGIADWTRKLPTQMRDETDRILLDAASEKAGPEDDRTEGQRFHDALRPVCGLRILSIGTGDAKRTSEFAAEYKAATPRYRYLLHRNSPRSSTASTWFRQARPRPRVVGRGTSPQPATPGRDLPGRRRPQACPATCSPSG